MSGTRKAVLGGVLLGVGLGMGLAWLLVTQLRETNLLGLGFFPLMIGGVLLGGLESTRRTDEASVGPAERPPA